MFPSSIRELSWVGMGLLWVKSTRQFGERFMHFLDSLEDKE